MKDKILKRQEELRKEFDALVIKKNEIIVGLQDMDSKLNQLTGAYNELGKQIKEEDENKT